MEISLLRSISEASAAIDDDARLDDPNYSPTDQDSLDPQERLGAHYKLLKLSYYGDPNNADANMYVGLRDGDGHEATIIHPNANVAKLVGWHDWYILLDDFKAKNANLDLNDVARIYIGFGNRTAPAPGGRGAVLLRRYPTADRPVCILGTVTCDFTGNCAVNAADLQRITEVWLGAAPTGANPLIQLNASGLSVCLLLTSWSNTGTEGGKFDVNTADMRGAGPWLLQISKAKRPFGSTRTTIWSGEMLQTISRVLQAQLRATTASP